MALKTLRTVLLGGVVTLASVTGIAFAAGSGPVGDYKMKHPDWSFKGAFGQFDRESVQRGYQVYRCLLYTSPSPRDRTRSRMPSSA